MLDIQTKSNVYEKKRSLTQSGRRKLRNVPSLFDARIGNTRATLYEWSPGFLTTEYIICLPKIEFGFLDHVFLLAEKWDASIEHDN